MDECSKHMIILAISVIGMIYMGITLADIILHENTEIIEISSLDVGNFEIIDTKGQVWEIADLNYMIPDQMAQLEPGEVIRVRWRGGVWTPRVWRVQIW